MSGAQANIVTIDAPISFFRGDERIADHEAVGIADEIWRFGLQHDEASAPDRFDLIAADVAQHRRAQKRPGRR